MLFNEEQCKTILNLAGVSATPTAESVNDFLKSLDTRLTAALTAYINSDMCKSEAACKLHISAPTLTARLNKTYNALRHMEKCGWSGTKELPLDASVTELGLMGCMLVKLLNHNITRVEQLVKFTPTQLKRITPYDRAVYYSLAQYGLSLRNEDTPIENFEEDDSIYLLDLPDYLCDQLVSVNISTVGALTSMSVDDLLSVHSIGTKTVYEIQLTLEKNGLTLIDVQSHDEIIYDYLSSITVVKNSLKYVIDACKNQEECCKCVYFNKDTNKCIFGKSLADYARR